MRTLLFALALGLATLPGVAGAEDGDVSLTREGQPLVGEPFTVRFEVRTSDGARVEVDFVNESWGAAEILKVVSHDIDTEGVGAMHRFEVLLTSFELGEVVVSPSVIVSDSGREVRRSLASVSVTVVSSLAADAPLTLSPPQGARSIDGGQSPFLVPGIVAAGVVAAAGIFALLFVLLRSVLRSWSLPGPEGIESDEAEAAEPLVDAEGLLDSDPVGAYRIIARSVRRALTEAYLLPVASMTTDELNSRLEPGGVDSWVVRMATDLLSQCDAVVYAGYRPAPERRRGDLTVAGEILRVAE